MTTVYHLVKATSSRITCHVTIISNWFLEYEFTKLKRPPQSPDLNPIEHFWDVVEQEIMKEQKRFQSVTSKVYLKWPLNVYIRKLIVLFSEDSLN